jgi:DNA-binding beta-propeller fold protein YncE
MCTNGGGDIFVADPCWDRTFVFSAGGAPLRWWSNPKSCWGIAVAADGRVFATQPTADDASGSSVFVFTSDGNLLARWDTNGTGPGEFYGPMGVAVSAADELFVTERGNARVQKLTLDGTPLAEWGSRGTGPGQFGDPEGIALGPDGLVYVTDAQNQTIQVFTTSGSFVRQWGGELGAGPGQFHGVRGVALDSGGNVYVADTGNHRIQTFDRFGKFQDEWGGYGSGPGQFDNPFSIVVATDGRIYVGDFNARIQVFGPVPTATRTMSWGRLKAAYR